MCFQNPVQARLLRDLKTHRHLACPSTALLIPFRVISCDSWLFPVSAFPLFSIAPLRSGWLSAYTFDFPLGSALSRGCCGFRGSPSSIVRLWSHLVFH